MGGKKPQIVTMDLDPSASVGIQRHNGFLGGMGLPLDTPQVIGSALTQGDQTKAQQQMENLLQRVGDKVNVVYNINEPAARGAYQALKEKGLAGKVIVGAIDGGCRGVQQRQGRPVRRHRDAVPQEDGRGGRQRRHRVREEGVKPTGFVDTGAMLITDKPVAGPRPPRTPPGVPRTAGA